MKWDQRKSTVIRSIRKHVLKKWELFHPTQEPRATEGRVLLNVVVPRTYKEGTRDVYYEDMYDR